jgi:hypothetical protein
LWADATPARYVVESHSTVIVEEHASLKRSNVHILKTVIVVVAYRAAQKGSRQLIDARARGHVDEMSCAVSAIKLRYSPYQQNIGVAVVVVVEERASISNGLQDVERSFP